MCKNITKKSSFELFLFNFVFINILSKINKICKAFFKDQKQNWKTWAIMQFWRWLKRIQTADGELAHEVTQTCTQSS